ncbi:MAG: hypothetical protein ACOYXN_12815 [Acidobacteriota bacterium]
MKIEDFASARRSPEAWDEFTLRLGGRIRARRRRRAAARVAALGLLAGLGVALWVGIPVPRSEPLLNAVVPAASSPAFQADGGSALEADRALVVIVEEPG